MSDIGALPQLPPEIPDGSPRYASIDIGSNTLKLLVAARVDEGVFVPVFETSWACRLGEDIASGRLADAAAARTLAALDQAMDVARHYGVDGVAAVGTSALRDAANKDEFVAEAVRRGVPLTAISGQEESALSLAAVMRDPQWRAVTDLLVIDIGGGSTELIIAQRPDESPVSRISAQVGAVRCTETMFTTDPPSAEEIESAAAAIRAAFADAPPAPYGTVGVLVGGTGANIGSVMLEMVVREPEKLHGLELHRTEVERQVSHYAALGVEVRRTIVGLSPARADIILAGALILEQVMRMYQLPSVQISLRGLRWGLLYTRFGGSD